LSPRFTASVRSVTICIAGSGEGVYAAHRPVAQLKMILKNVWSHHITISKRKRFKTFKV
jgi:hypothetical protein